MRDKLLRALGPTGNLHVMTLSIVLLNQLQ